MLYVLLAVILGVVAGLFLPLPLDSSYSMYFVVGILTALDSVIGALRSYMNEEYDALIFVSGFFLNAFVAVFLAYVGDRLGLPLYYAAIFVFGTRLFSNISIIRRKFIEAYREKKSSKAEAVSSDDEQSEDKN